MRLQRLCLAVLLLAVLLLLAFGNPHSTAWPLKCPLYWLTGWQCPLCGSQRAVHEFLIGNWREAWTLNPAFWLLVPYLAVLLAGQMKPALQKANRLVCFCYRTRTMGAVIDFMLIWGVVRNL